MGEGPQGCRVLKILDSSEIANILSNAHDYRPERAKCHSPGWNEVNPRVHDVLPTIYNLFGIEYDSRLFTGVDILSTTSGLAVFSNRSWKTDTGTYFASGSKFVGEANEDYITNMNNIVKNRLSIAKLIIKSNYYKYLLK